MTFDGGNVCFNGGSCMPWAGALTYLVSVLVLLALTLGVLLWDARRTPTPSQAASRANRHATLASAVGLALMVVVLTWVFGGYVLGVVPRDGRVLAVLPALGGACLLAAQAVGQLTWPRPTGARREAELARRSVADATPTSARPLVLGWAGLAFALLVVFGVVAEGPRSLISGPYGGGTEAPGYPGWYYGVPMGLAIIALVAATEFVLRLITGRPAVVGVSSEWDLHLRRRSAGHVARGVQLALAVTVAGTLVAAGWGHRAVGMLFGPRSQYDLGTGLLIAALCVLLTGLALTVLPLRRGQRKARALMNLAATP